MPLDYTNWKTPANIMANVIAEKLPDVFQLGVNLFVGVLPSDPADCVVIIDSGGGLQDPSNAIDDISFQVFSRNLDYQLGYNLQNLIKSELQTIGEAILDDERIIGIWVKSNISVLGRDESDRSLFSSNYRAMIDTQKDVNRDGEHDNFIDGGSASSF